MKFAKLPIRIYPSLLASDFGKLGAEVERCEAAGCDGLHLDVMDGHFVPNLTMGPDIARAVRRHAKSPIDCHLMVTDPLPAARQFAEAGVDAITFHIEVAPDAPSAAAAIRKLNKKAGVSLNPDTPASALAPALPHVDHVLVMTVFPGFGGQKFIEACVSKIREIRAMGFEGDLQVDGGIQDTTAAACAAAGANVFIAGTYLLGAPDIAARAQLLRSRAAAAFEGSAAAPHR